MDIIKLILLYVGLLEYSEIDRSMELEGESSSLTKIKKESTFIDAVI